MSRDAEARGSMHALGTRRHQAELLRPLPQRGILLHCEIWGMVPQVCVFKSCSGGGTGFFSLLEHLGYTLMPLSWGRDMGHCPL